MKMVREILEELIQLKLQISSLNERYSILLEQLQSHCQSITDVILVNLDYDQHGQLYNRNRPIGPNGAELIAKALYGNEHLCNLEIGFNKVGNQGLQHISTIIKSTKLEELDLVDSGITFEGIREFAPCLVQTTLKTLVLSRNPIGDAGVEVLLDALTNSQIETLGLDNTGLTTIGIKTVSQFVSTHKHLRGLDLSLNNITGTSTQYLSKAIQQSPKLLDLDLHGNEITDDDIFSLSAGLHLNRTLRSFNLADNQIESRGAMYLCKVITFHPTLQDLRLDDNMIDAEGCQYLLESLDRNHRLIIKPFEVHSLDDGVDIREIKMRMAQLQERNENWIVETTSRAKEMLKLSRLIMVLDLPLEIKQLIFSLNASESDWVMKKCLLERRWIGLYDDHPFDCISLARVCYHLLRSVQ